MIGTNRSQIEIGERGAALVTVLFISLLLLTASAAMLSAIGANSRNTTDILSETKAYYAAETGIQATVNVLRNAVDGSGNPLKYSAVVADDDLSTWLAYSGGQVPVSTGTGYSIFLTNPDPSNSVTYSTSGKFTGGSIGDSNGDRLCIADGASAGQHCIAVDGNVGNWTEIRINGTASAGAPGSPNAFVGTFTVRKSASGGATGALTNATFRIDYRIFLSPRVSVASIYGKITQSNVASPFSVTFNSPEYVLFGTRLRLCETSTTASPCPIVAFDLADTPVSFYANYNSGAVEPFRLLVTATGYGPNGAKKKLEGVIRRNFFDGYDPPATMALIGPNTSASGNFLYDPGNSSGVGYRGCDCDLNQVGCQPNLCIPAFGLTDETNLATVNSINTSRGINVQRGSFLLDENNLPEWLQTPLALDGLISRLRVAAQHAGTWYAAGADNVNPGSLTTGTGITFCEGDCNVNDGGGLLVVRGRLTVNGNFDFHGMILITGQGGFRRTGGGSGQVAGNILIAPYAPNPTLASDFLPPQYEISGGGGSVVPVSDVNPFIENTSAISDIVFGVAEK